MIRRTGEARLKKKLLDLTDGDDIHIYNGFFELQ